MKIHESSNSSQGFYQKIHTSVQEKVSGWTILTRSLITDVDFLIYGGGSIDIRNYLNLCTLVDALILSPGCLILGLAGTPLTDSHLFKFLNKNNITNSLQDVLYDRKAKTIPGFAAQVGLIDFATDGGIPLNNEARYSSLDSFLCALRILNEASATWIPELDIEVFLSKEMDLNNLRNWLDDHDLGDSKIFKSLSHFINNVGQWLSVLENVKRITGLSSTDDCFVSCISPHITNTYNAQSRILYDVLTKVLRDKIDELMKYTGMRTVYIPPLVSILLSRCKGREDIPEQILKMREEFKDIRDIETHNAGIINNTKLSLEERLDAIKQMHEIETKFSNTFREKGSRKFVYRIWDFLKEGNLTKITFKLLDTMMARNESYEIRQRIQPYLDLKQAATEIREYENLIKKVFREEMHEPFISEYQAINPLNKIFVNNN